MMIRLVNGFFPEAVKNESMSPLRRGRLVELALDRRVRPGVAFAGDQVDAGVGFTVAARPVDPPPHLVVLLGEHRIELEVTHHQLLELRAAFGVRRRLAERFDHLVYRRQRALPLHSPGWWSPSYCSKPG